MSIDATGIHDQLTSAGDYRRPNDDHAGIYGHGVVELHGPDGALKQRVEFENLVTQVGDQYIGERAAGLAGMPAAITGMQLGTGTTAVAKTGAGAAIVTLVAASLVAVGTPVSSLSGSSRRIAYATTWAAGTATATGISEVVMTNQATGTQTAAGAAATMARALLSPTVNKAAGDSLSVTWNVDVLGS